MTWTAPDRDTLNARLRAVGGDVAGHIARHAFQLNLDRRRPYPTDTSGLTMDQLCDLVALVEQAAVIAKRGP